MREEAIHRSCRRTIRQKYEELKVGRFSIDILAHFLQNKSKKLRDIERETPYKKIYLEEAQRMISLVYKAKRISKTFNIRGNDYERSWKLLDILERLQK
jgi:hypothetical protein